MSVLSAMGMAVATAGTLAVSVFAGMLLMRAMLKALEAAATRTTAVPAASVTDFSEYARMTTGSLVGAREELSRAA
jgi:hypothetical protein